MGWNYEAMSQNKPFFPFLLTWGDVCVCVCAIPKCMGAHVHRCTCMCVGTHAKARSWCLVSSSIVLYFLNSVFHLNPELKDPANLASNLVLRMPHPHSLAFCPWWLGTWSLVLTVSWQALKPQSHLTSHPFLKWQVFCSSIGCFSAIHRAVHWHIKPEITRVKSIIFRIVVQLVIWETLQYLPNFQ